MSLNNFFHKTNSGFNFFLKINSGFYPVFNGFCRVLMLLHQHCKGFIITFGKVFILISTDFNPLNYYLVRISKIIINSWSSCLKWSVCKASGSSNSWNSIPTNYFFILTFNLIFIFNFTVKAKQLLFHTKKFLIISMYSYFNFSNLFYFSALSQCWWSIRTPCPHLRASDLHLSAIIN